MLVEQGGHLTFTVNWVQNVLNVIIQSERKMVRRMYITVRNNTLKFESAKFVPVKVKRKRKEITEFFRVSAIDRFLSMQLIYACKTRCT